MNYMEHKNCPSCGSDNIIISDDSKRICNNCGDEICNVININNSGVEDKNWKNNSSEQHIKNVINKTNIDLKKRFEYRIPTNIINEICDIYKEILMDITNRGEIKLGIIGHCIDYVCLKNKIYISTSEIIEKLEIEKKNFEKSLIMFDKLVTSKKIPSLSQYYLSDKLTLREIMTSMKDIIGVTNEDIEKYEKIKNDLFEEDNFNGENHLCAVFLYDKMPSDKLTKLFDISKTTLTKLRNKYEKYKKQITQEKK